MGLVLSVAMLHALMQEVKSAIARLAERFQRQLFLLLWLLLPHFSFLVLLLFQLLLFLFPPLSFLLLLLFQFLLFFLQRFSFLVLLQIQFLLILLL